MTKTYALTCPDPDCKAAFSLELDPETEEETITCPRCGIDWDWEHDPATDTLVLVDFGENDDEEEYLDDDDEDPDNEEDDGDDDE